MSPPAVISTARHLHILFLQRTTDNLRPRPELGPQAVVMGARAGPGESAELPNEPQSLPNRRYDEFSSKLQFGEQMVLRNDRVEIRSSG
jgi:hypothetical protein